MNYVDEKRHFQGRQSPKLQYIRTRVNSGKSGKRFKDLMHVKSIVAQMSFRWLGVVVGKTEGIVSAQVLDESRSFFRVHTGYFSNIPKCIKAEFIASWACSQSSVVSSSQR
ncbi:hypothetical protein TNCV_4940591 [Trichonephila clavipes]|nr:hypothetical protein TNCV_4940591 [Trichonephila clavipes]